MKGTYANGPKRGEYVDSLFYKDSLMVPPDLELHPIHLPSETHSAILHRRCMAITAEGDEGIDVGDLLLLICKDPGNIKGATDSWPFLVLVTHVRPLGEDQVILSIRKIRLVLADV